MTGIQIRAKGNSFVQVIKERDDGISVLVGTFYVQQHIDAISLIGVTPPPSYPASTAAIASTSAVSTAAHGGKTSRRGKKGYESLTPPSELQRLSSIADNMLAGKGK